MRVLIGLVAFLGSVLPTASMPYTCATMEPICTADGVAFPAQSGTNILGSDATNNFQCLGSTPNPSWYYLEIATAGHINFQLYAPNDIDFIIWGPFTDLSDATSSCNGLLDPVVDCSYSSTNSETPSILNAQVGEVYVLLITNYADSMQDISLSQTSGQGMTDCSILEPEPAPTPAPAGGGGDPHMKTWSGAYYDYHGACDLVMLSDPFFLNNKGLEVQIRTTIRYDYSFIEAVAVKIGDEVLEVASFGEYILEGTSSAEMPAKLSNFPVTHTQVNKKEHLFEIIVDVEKDHKIIIKTFKDWVSIKFTLPLSGSIGMLGEYETGTLFARDGNTVVNDPVAFGAEWQVRDSETNLFETLRAPQYPQACSLPMPQMEGRRLGGTTVTESAAKEACAHLGSKQDQELCVYDVMATGDLDMAQAGAF